MFKKIKYNGLLLILLAMLAANTKADGLFSIRSVTVETAYDASWAALTDCRSRGYSVAVAVVDRGGNVQVLLRDRFAGPHTIQTAIQKAWTANSFRQSTAALAGLLEDKKIPNQVANNPGALLVGGGLVIQSAGEIIGAIGVSGAPPGKSERDSIDGNCAQAGLTAIRETLEFAE
ncbi:MAG: heme-binding protein [Gammaproteobacteria bacterium]|nr:heme-binding protein [Gammaproteobacteria bacterium]